MKTWTLIALIARTLTAGGAAGTTGDKLPDGPYRMTVDTGTGSRPVTTEAAGQGGRTLVVAQDFDRQAWGSVGVASPVYENNGRLKATALADLTGSFNFLGGKAAQLRRLMAGNEADAFDAVLEDVMAALLSLPKIGMKDPANPQTLKPKAARPERVGQLVPNLNAMDKFFGRLENQYPAAAERRLLASSRKSIQKMLRALPLLLPTVPARPIQQREQERQNRKSEGATGSREAFWRSPAAELRHRNSAT